MDEKTMRAIEEYINSSRSPLGSYSGVTDDDLSPTQDADDL